MNTLANRKCKPCEGGVAPLPRERVAAYLRELDSDWSLSADGKRISRVFKFPAYSRTVAFSNAVIWIATTEGHHPELTIVYGSCSVTYSTYAIDGLSENDFICAAKIDRLFGRSEP